MKMKKKITRGFDKLRPRDIRDLISELFLKRVTKTLNESVNSRRRDLHFHEQKYTEIKVKKKAQKPKNKCETECEKQTVDK
jgi:hypothetical protein